MNSKVRKKKEEKRKEEYKKAVEHKMKSAAEVVDSYRKAYELTDDDSYSMSKRNRTLVNDKLYKIIGGIFLQALILLLVILLIFLSVKNSFKEDIDNCFSSSKPEFSAKELKEEYTSSTNETESVYYADIDEPDKGTCYAEISVKNVNQKIYYGFSDEALLQGVCQYSKTSLPGFNKPIMLYGYSSTSFSNVGDLQNDDIVTITTNYGVYRYKVTTASVFSNNENVPYNLEAEKEILVLCTDYPFDEYKMSNSETYCVIAEKVSGPQVTY